MSGRCQLNNLTIKVYMDGYAASGVVRCEDVSVPKDGYLIICHL